MAALSPTWVGSPAAHPQLHPPSHPPPHPGWPHEPTLLPPASCIVRRTSCTVHLELLRHHKRLPLRLGLTPCRQIKVPEKGASDRDVTRTSSNPFRSFASLRTMNFSVGIKARLDCRSPSDSRVPENPL
ncbi:uncharacterized protein PAN0_042c6370 [Moesziomyces antarcticus]|uniref:Uncharacterized protein n=1 Tax=Pseudozyma antarctica TaxID=84753 RepID=A0A081CN90_PSEA2|nr:uncharacterized protein PAN0_042c6370 [Moesziomyces antarcticus]GAK68136.1 hypothetical protein PAN0_042c6370 [Moesziomyces antarcticus]